MVREGKHSLSPAYRAALRLRAEGYDDEAIAAELDITVEAVPALLVLAERKQARAEES